MDFKDVRSSFGLASKSLPISSPIVDDRDKIIIADDFKYPPVIEGSELFDTLCPVSKLTGHRENPLSLLGKITGAKSDLLNGVLQELPTIASDPRLTDEDRVATVVERLSTGSPAEDSIMAQRIMSDLDALGLRHKVDVVQPVDDKIQFDASDVSNAE